MKTVFMYAGQGSQYYQMGKELYAGSSVFKSEMDRLNEHAIAYGGSSIVDVLYDPQKKPSDPLNRLSHTHPAIFMVEYALSQVLMDMGIMPDYLLGASLGEYVTLAVSGVCDSAKVLELLIQESLLVEQSDIAGGMIAVVASKEVFIANRSYFRNCELASDNFDGHFVLSGNLSDLESARSFLKEHKLVYHELAVNHPFHSQYIKKIEHQFLSYANTIDFKKPKVEIVSCAFREISPLINKQYLWDIVQKPIGFRETHNLLKEQEDMVYIDLGPSGTLSTFVNYNQGIRNNTFPILSPYGASENNLKKLEKAWGKTKKRMNSSTQKDTTKMEAFLFPGQGSQKKGMGGQLFDYYSNITRIADAILGYSIKELCLHDPEKKLVQTQFSQVAIYVVNALNYYKQLEEGKKPDIAVGHSLGEYNALLAAGAFDFETGLKLVQKRGLLMAESLGGGMAAVIGLEQEKIRLVLEENKLDSIDIANYNSPEQIVLSGPKQDILDNQTYFEKAGAKLYIPLMVSGAFHSRYMKLCSDKFAVFIENFDFQPLKIPVIANLTARPYTDSSIKEKLVKQIVSPVHWIDSIRYLMGQGTTDYYEVGDVNILTKLLEAIQLKATPIVEMADGVSSTSQPDKKTTISRVNETVLEEVERRGMDKDKEIVSMNYRAIQAEELGSMHYKKAHKLKYAYVAGSMYKGIASANIVVAMAKAGMMGYFGTGGLSLDQLEKEIVHIKSELTRGESYGFNLIHNMTNPQLENDTINLYLKHGVCHIEASAFMQARKPLVKFRLKGLSKAADGTIVSVNRIQAKISRPEVAELFLLPPPERLVQSLVEEGEITLEEASLATQVPLATEICVEADSGGHTDRGNLSILLPAILRLRDKIAAQMNYFEYISVGAAGGIGTPEAASTAFLLGADFILTGSINQCTVEANTSKLVKDMLAVINVQDTEYAPAGDMFELGAKVQVLKKGVFFPSRANILFDLYNRYPSYDEIDVQTKEKLEKNYFKKSAEEIYKECKQFYSAEEIEKAERKPKIKMAMIFKWYFGFTSRAALSGDEANRVNFQVHCGPSLGAFNQWVENTELKIWQNRNVDKIGELLMLESAQVINQRFQSLLT